MLPNNIHPLITLLTVNNHALNSLLSFAIAIIIRIVFLISVVKFYTFCCRNFDQSYVTVPSYKPVKEKTNYQTNNEVTPVSGVNTD